MNNQAVASQPCSLKLAAVCTDRVFHHCCMYLMENELMYMIFYVDKKLLFVSTFALAIFVYLHRLL